MTEMQQQPTEDSYLRGAYSLKAWLLTLDHKRIAWLYIVSITAMFLIGGIAATLMRLELVTPEADLLSADGYNRSFSLHGIIMIWFFLVPSIPATLGNFLLPIMIGARDMAFPRLNLLSWYVYSVGAVFTLVAVIAGGVDTGWTFYTPLSSMYANGNVIAAISGVFIVGFSSILTGINFIATVHTMRAPGIMVLATPVLAITLLLLALERLLGIGIFDPALGGDPLLFQHLFWFYSHPAVYIMILPGMGVVSEIITCFARNPIFGYRFMVYSILGIALVGFLVWGHHMFVSGQSLYASLVFSLLSFIVAVPSGIKVFNWTATLYRGNISLQSPMLYVLGFIALFTVGGLTGLFLASIAVDVQVHDTYFVVAHFHYIMVGGMVMAFLGGLHFWWPKMTGRLYDEFWAKTSLITIFIGFNLTFFPQFILGYLGMPRRYHTYTPEFTPWHVASSLGTLFLALGYLLPLLNLGWSIWRGKLAGSDPWGATGLEWQTSSPPPQHNFDTTPQVLQPPYQYSGPETEQAQQ